MTHGYEFFDFDYFDLDLVDMLGFGDVPDWELEGIMDIEAMDINEDWGFIDENWW